MFECLLTSITLAFAGKRVALVLRARGLTAAGFVRLNVEATAEVRRSSTLWWLAFRVYGVREKHGGEAVVCVYAGSSTEANRRLL